jgi:hypothetical protein
MAIEYAIAPVAELKQMSDEQLIKRNEELMLIKARVTEEQLRLKQELDSRIALKDFNAMPQAMKDAIIQHITAGNLTVGR